MLMREYLYPAHPCGRWFDKEVIDNWPTSEKPFFAFSFCWYTPHGLINRENSQHDNIPFWLYIYYSESKIREAIRNDWGVKEDLDFAQKVEYRIRVTEFKVEKENPFVDTSTYNASPCDDEKIWFRCDRVEMIKKLNPSGQFVNLDLNDFRHIDQNLSHAQAMINSIAPVCRKSPLVIRKSWQYTDEPASCSSQP
jgi:hypothetical protein